MLSHFRIHRRGPSNPSSPVPDQLSPLDHAEPPHSVQDISNRTDFLPRSTNAANTPPILPAGPRTDPDPTPNRKPSEQSLKDSPSPPVKSPQSTSESGFMGGLALENYRRAFGAKREDSSAVVRQAPAGQQNTRSKPLPPPINTNLPSAHPPPVPIKELRSRSSFVAPTELYNNAGATGKRPSGTRLTSEPAALAASQSVSDSQKGKKGLPFLKNPMSGLLMRRKASQNAPDLRPLPLPQNPAEATYDPRIRGTRVHDFSAPRKRVVPTRKPTVPGAEVWSGPQGASSNVAPDLPLRSPTGKSSSAVSEKTQPGTSDTESQRPHELSKESSKKSATEHKRVSLDDKPLPEEPEPSSSDDVEPKRSASGSGPSAATNNGSITKANPSTRTNKSRHISLSDGSIKDGVALALPKHMKSTSSRFSFDMMGAARAEKALEERHRQKELERKANNMESGHRDSRFDDFDDDTFDYDAAMAEDGFEEDIPMVGDDDFLDDDAFFEEDVPVVGDEIVDTEDDPDNDQENFAGFVFQRSNPQSSLASPAAAALLATPRDASGKAIGYAMTKDTTPDPQSATSPLANTETPVDQEEDLAGADGLGIQVTSAPRKTQYDPTVFQERRYQPVDDGADLGSTEDKELYFDEGLLEELRMEADEIQASAFDESIFDINDTDEFGRPIPGAFAQAQASRAVQEQEVRKRESDIASASGMSGSTAHTSVSLGLQPMPSMTEKAKELSSQQDNATVTSSQMPSEGNVVAYQAALAEAAHKAAASGWKFKWEEQLESPPSPSPSPPPPPPPADPDVTITSPTTGSQPNSGGQIVDDSAQDEYDDYADYDDGFGGGFDDNFDDEFEFDDDFIAEANAEALAYDSDGFYGQEFGFYSAPIPQGHHGTSKSNGTSLTADNVYGGYFGPSGIGRTTSGRVVSREPNLTPITERSEYSNRNSIMSLGLPMGTSEGRNSLQSPGLAQLAMMTDDGKMSLAELLRLRSKAWGGSQVSLNSSREGSPRSERAPPGDRFEGTSSPAPWETGRPNSHLSLAGGTHVRKNSAFSLWSNSDAASGAGSPTMTMGLSLPNNAPPQPLFSPPPPPLPQPSPGPQCPPVIEDEEEASSPGLSTKSPTLDHAQANKDAYDANAKIDTAVTPVDVPPPPPPAPLESPPPPPPNTTVSSPSKRLGHRHKSSAESISYSMDEDRESGETRWVMERRRTADSGEIEVLRREVVSAGSI
ncbi:hypothetical protein N8I77_005743 [Diaporthe amygdali]|uniref:AGC-kinase C-terminal domain-containing protein n=1 Tax=Phomopsis amygdali TaxID=1214568 RepID=A0AAD9SEK3_PHOAM|nr:hypothetical protein N8I77_005743 [Diaporthe amygdali]